MRTLGVIVALLVGSTAYCQQNAARGIDIVLSQGSSRINGVELRTGPRRDAPRFFSLPAAEKALGAPEDTYVPRGVQVYAWSKVGIHLQRGWRSDEKGKLYKLQVYLEDDHDSRVDKHTGEFPGTIMVDGVAIKAGTLLQNVRRALEAAGFHTEDTAEKGEIRVLAINPERKIDRIEQWCL